MKIVDRKTFMEMPAGTVYMEYEPSVFGDLKMKGDTTGNDFLFASLSDAVDSTGTEDYIAKVDDAVENGTSVPMDYDCYGRDGMFDEDQLFAVLEQQDVEQLIVKLNEALEDKRVLINTPIGKMSVSGGCMKGEVMK